MKTLLASLAVGLGLLASPALQVTAQAQNAPLFAQDVPYSGLRSLPGSDFPDQAPFSSMRFDKLEWNRQGRFDSARWDMEAFYGSDYDKLFLKSEGFYSGRSNKFDEAQMQVLYSHLISYFFDLQIGIRQDFSALSRRTYAAIGIEGLAPGLFEVDATAYVSQKGEISGSFTTWYDLLITNRLVLQPRVDVRLQLQRIPELQLGSGFTDLELGARLRYEFTREIAPYIGVTWDRRLGETATFAKRNDERPSSVYFVGGVRLLW
ncbi:MULTISPECIES: copper resistance protein B [Methylorubrum]|uniref:Copper resistance protein CopB n=2 Tax=Methylorubrum TaxID=2282523 RepID=C5B1T7_METEA|nr:MULTISPECIES: copper resistance protein B [Methylorubrum]MBY0138886.1 copper resistance protein B [Methylorubrum populi]ACS39721.1 Putative copper resistance protein CopB [Methylorubrum extorquens AM1]MBK3404440.1 copper resistance protein B [Methylorubrum rhodesianum]MCP1542140.1 copper resistance protein B [Methylorubrum extorquens]MCP1590515.1 copper resistance protein B [Methylorubrum extorquens]